MIVFNASYWSAICRKLLQIFSQGIMVSNIAFGDGNELSSDSILALLLWKLLNFSKNPLMKLLLIESIEFDLSSTQCLMILFSVVDFFLSLLSSFTLSSIALITCYHKTICSLMFNLWIKDTKENFWEFKNSTVASMKSPLNFHNPVRDFS